MMRPVLAATLGTASASLLRVGINNNTLSVPGMTNYGSSKCPCVGFDNVGGVTEVTSGGQKMDYPADLGARCTAWDEDKAPACKGANPEGWCSQQWCYVDPCNCDLPDIPKISAYLPDAKYQGKPVYYSYETCGGKDEYTSEHHKKACVNQETKEACGGNSKCLWNDDEGKCGGKDVMSYCMRPLPVNTWGEGNCKCVGIHNQPGTVEVQVGDPATTMDYPADLGATCNSWDMDRHPECKGSDKPGWCTDRWCYVDPCSCDHEVPPTEAGYMPDSTFQGKPIFYSYATCGTENRFTGKQTEKAKEHQAYTCSSAWAVTPVAAMFLSFLSM